jgi:hypothetical protein
MHPPLFKPHPQCEDFVKQLVKCHEDRTIGKLVPISIYMNSPIPMLFLYQENGLAHVMKLSGAWMIASERKKRHDGKPMRREPENSKTG